jgi:hypothetical protein
LEIDVMKRYIVLIAVVSAVMITAFNAFGQDEETPAQKMQRQRREQQAQMRQRFRNMSPEEREKLRAEMEQRRKQYRNMSDEQRAKLREQMRERSGSRPRPGSLGRNEQLKSIKAIETQLAKLKAAVIAGVPENRERLRELSQKERLKVREKMMTAMRERRAAIRAIERELARLRGPGRPATVSEARLGELRAIHKLAVREKATRTADRLDKLIMGIQRGSAGRERTPRESRNRPRRERPARREKTE